MSEQPAKANLAPELLTGSKESALSELERQVERGSFFTHTAIGLNALRLGEAETFVYGLLDALIAKKIISSDEVSAAVENVRQEMAAQGDVPSAGVALRIDHPEETNQPPVKVNCAERMPICQAICCKLHFALTQQEVESGKVKWDLGQPYHIRQGFDGRCTHQDRQTGGCGVYADRPGICRSYSCANDKRIWKDFEKMELNREWLEQNLNGSSGPRLLRALMQNIEPSFTDEASTSDNDGKLLKSNDEPS